MSFITRIRKSARDAARSQLSKLGIQVPSVDLPLDADTEERDIVDIYRDIVQKSQPQVVHPDPIPEDLRTILEENIIPICGMNEILKETVHHWIAHRDESEHSPTNAPTLENLKSEAFQMLRTASVIQPMSEQWELTLSDIARAQFRPVINLIHQIARQIGDENANRWLELVNSKLARYRLTVIQIGANDITLVDSKHAKQMLEFWAQLV